MALCMPSPARQPPPAYLSRTCSGGVGFCAILHTAICCLVSETIPSLLPPNPSAQLPLSQTASFRLQTTSWLLFIFDQIYAPTPCSSSHLLLGAPSSVAVFACGSFFLPLQRTVNVQLAIRDMWPPAITLWRCFLRSAF